MNEISNNDVLYTSILTKAMFELARGHLPSWFCTSSEEPIVIVSPTKLILPNRIQLSKVRVALVARIGIVVVVGIATNCAAVALYQWFFATAIGNHKEQGIVDRAHGLRRNVVVLHQQGICNTVTKRNKRRL